MFLLLKPKFGIDSQTKQRCEALMRIRINLSPVQYRNPRNSFSSKALSDRVTTAGTFAFILDLSNLLKFRSLIARPSKHFSLSCNILLPSVERSSDRYSLLDGNGGRYCPKIYRCRCRTQTILQPSIELPFAA